MRPRKFGSRERFASSVVRVVVTVAGVVLAAGGTARAQVKLLNVSYDPTRELYVDINKAFAQKWQQQTGQSVMINQSHGGAGEQTAPPPPPPPPPRQTAPPPSHHP